MRGRRRLEVRRDAQLVGQIQTPADQHAAGAAALVFRVGLEEVEDCVTSKSLVSMVVRVNGVLARKSRGG